LRPALHRARGVRIGKAVFIGEEVFLDNEYPECIEIQDGAQLSIRTVVIAHTRGPGKVIIGKEAFLGPYSAVICGGGKVLKIGEAAVLAAGTIVTRSVPPRTYLAPPPPVPVAHVGVPLPVAESMGEFWAGLTPITRKGQSK